jgi:topoisomerase-4 subunit A
LIYRDGKSGPSYIKRFNVSGVTRDNNDLTNGKKDHKSSILLAIEMEKPITVILRQVGTIKKLKFDIDFAISLKGRASKGI